MHKHLLLPALTLLAAFVAQAVPELKLGTPLERPYDLDFRFQPPQWQTSICLIDDWQKTLVGKDGALLYDYPGPFADFGTRIQVGVADGEAEWVSQQLEDPCTPILKTILRAGKLELELTGFAVAGDAASKLAPMDPKLLKPLLPRGIEMIGEHAPQQAWAAPGNNVDPAFRDVDVGNYHPLRYRFAAEPKEKYWVEFGFCEGWWQEPGQRVLDLKLEGKTRETIDPVAKSGKNKAFVVPIEAEDINGDGWIDIEVAAAANAKDVNAILNVLWVFKAGPDPQRVVAGLATQDAIAYAPCGGTSPAPMGNPRVDLLQVTIHNGGNEIIKAQPRLLVQSDKNLAFDQTDATVLLRALPFLTVSRKVTAKLDGLTLTLDVDPLELPPNGSKTFIVAAHRNAAARVWSPEEAQQSLNSSREYWHTANLPYGVVSVPDPNVQALLDSSIRNIYQAREIKDGLPAFQVGPTCYRGLWIIDGSFLLESISMLGRTDATRAGVQYMLNHQKEDGSFEIIHQYWKETGIVLWVIDRHEQLTGDRGWLEQVWPRVEKAADFIIELRKHASVDPKAPYAGLTPPGFADGGVGGLLNEYTNTYWTLNGLKSAVAMAKRLGKNDAQNRWQAQFDDMWTLYRKAAERDTITDTFGNRVLPIPMDRPLKLAPQKGQWAFCHAIYPGELFKPDDPIMIGTMANLTDNEKEGLVYGTGWIDDGIWNYFGSFYTHAFLWLGQGQKAARTMYAFANHAAPTLLWREEQELLGDKYHVVGDMPHNWASAEFIRCVMHMLMLERGDELHLFEGLPPTWLKPGARIAIKNAVTRFGPISFRLQIEENGSGTLALEPPTRTPAKKIALHFDNWATPTTLGGKQIAPSKVLEINTSRPVIIELKNVVATSQVESK